MLIHSASQLLTLMGGPQRGSKLGALGIIENGGVLIADGLIQDIGKSDVLKAKYPNEKMFDGFSRLCIRVGYGRGRCPGSH